MPIERIIPLARQLLTTPLDESHHDLWLWEHSERVMRLTHQIADLPELRGAPPADRAALAAPTGRIFWAGEATEPDYHSTVHGAVISGRRAADEVLAAL